MEMGRLEKKFVNSKRHAKRNIRVLEQLFSRSEVHKKVQRVLEVGCGVGIVASHLSNKYGFKVTGTDLDSEQIKLAKDRNQEDENLRFLEVDATSLPFESGEFDMVLSIMVMHHIGEWGKALQEINRVLGRKGYYVFNDIAFPRLVTKTLGKVLRNYGVYTIDDITAFLEEKSVGVVHREEPKGLMMKQHSMIFQKH